MKRRELQGLIASYGIPVCDELFVTPDGLALLANLVNLSAKTISEQWYDWKGLLVEMALQCHNHCWVNDGVAYFETCVGQVSFHIFEDVDFDPQRHAEAWSGIETQYYAAELIIEFLGA